MKTPFTIEAAPIQGFLDHVVRAAHLHCFSGIDVWYTPFMMLEKGKLRSRDRRELALWKREDGLLAPQIAPSGPEEALTLKQIIVDAGFSSINLNLGCPYPMMTKHGRGAGLLPHPEMIAEILSALCDKGATVSVSVKTRLGLNDTDEFQAILPVLNAFALSKVIVHPRIAKEQYEGIPHWDVFDRYATELKAEVIANGDMETKSDVQRIIDRYPSLSGVMIGRGLLRDPFLAMRILNIPLPPHPKETLRAYHDAVLKNCNSLFTPPHVLDKMVQFWSYFADLFPNSHKVYKRIRKSKQLAAYAEAVDLAFQSLGAM